ncbi:MAG: hypothetical protein M3179_14380 [Actinomycetota bacterium]|nr:hypothetical protein [Actinomycetota bacterium]
MPTVQAPRKIPASLPRSNVLLAVVGAALAGALLLTLSSPLESPERVDHITVVNPQAWNAEIDVTTEARDGWLGIGAVDRQDEQTFGEVIDQGDRWVFRFSYGGEQSELVVDRGQLESEQWRVTVPSQFAERMRVGGVVESAR